MQETLLSKLRVDVTNTIFIISHFTWKWQHCIALNQSLPQRPGPTLPSKPQFLSTGCWNSYFYFYASKYLRIYKRYRFLKIQERKNGKKLGCYFCNKRVDHYSDIYHLCTHVFTWCQSLWSGDNISLWTGIFHCLQANIQFINTRLFSFLFLI